MSLLLKLPYDVLQYVIMPYLNNQNQIKLSLLMAKLKYYKKLIIDDLYLNHTFEVSRLNNGYLNDIETNLTPFKNLYIFKSRIKSIHLLNIDFKAVKHIYSEKKNITKIIQKCENLKSINIYVNTQKIKQDNHYKLAKSIYKKRCEINFIMYHLCSSIFWKEEIEEYENHKILLDDSALHIILYLKENSKDNFLLCWYKKILEKTRVTF